MTVEQHPNSTWSIVITPQQMFEQIEFYPAADENRFGKKQP